MKEWVPAFKVGICNLHCIMNPSYHEMRHLHVWVCIHVHACMCVRVCACACMRVCVCMCMRARVCVRAYMHACVHACMRVYFQSLNHNTSS